MQDLQRVAVFGASGLVGKAVTDALLTKGKYAVNAMMRNPGALGLNHAFLKLIQGDVLNQQVVEQTLEGCIAVVVTISHPLEDDNQIFTQTAKVISAACLKVGVKRVIQVAGLGLLDENGSYYYESPTFPEKYIKISKDHVGAFKVYMEAGLDVTAICPPIIKQQKFTGNYAIQAETVVANNLWIVGNGEVADLILKEIQNPQYIGKRVSITDIVQQ